MLRYVEERTRCERGTRGVQGVIMKPRRRPDKKLHIRKKVAAGATGTLVGALMGGPVGALVGGVIGTAVGDAAEKANCSSSTPGREKRANCR